MSIFKYPVFYKLYADRCIIACQLLFFTRVLFHGEHVFQINPLYVHVLGRKLILTVNFLADRQITARSFTLYDQSDY